MEHGPASEWKEDKSEGFKTKLGLFMVAIYTIVYFAFIVIAVTNPQLMAKDIGGLNLAIAYGFGIIILAIIQALMKKRIAGAAFDVYETWPVQPDSPLLKLDNVVLTPHIAGATAESIVRHSQMIVDDIERFLRGERPKNLLNPKVSRRAGQ